jgi:hypothetical protein
MLGFTPAEDNEYRAELLESGIKMLRAFLAM